MSNNFCTFLDWLYIDDPKEIPKQGSIILFPRMLDRCKVASLIIYNWKHPSCHKHLEYSTSELSKYFNIHVITDNPQDYINSFSLTNSNSESCHFSLSKYSNLLDINEFIKSKEINIIIFDDLRMLATISSAIDFSFIQPKIIVLSSWGDTIKQFDQVTYNLPGLRLLALDLISDIATINWKNIKINMSDSQKILYNKVRNNELINNTPTLYPITRMLGLYLYPEGIIPDLLSYKSVCEINNNDSCDKLGQSNTWLNIDYLNTLENDGPKLHSLVDNIISNWPNKQIIFTRYNIHYGVNLINSILLLMSQNKKNPYDQSEILKVSCTDNYNDIINLMHNFNEMNSGILITNIVPLISLKNINFIHITDNYSFLTIKMIIDRCHKHHLNKESNSLTICSYISILGNETSYNQKFNKLKSNEHDFESEKSADEFLHDILIFNINECNRIYNGLVSLGGHIVFKPNIGLIVT